MDRGIITAPPGLIRPGRNALRKGLSLAWAGQNLPHPAFLTRGSLSGAFFGTQSRLLGPAGWQMGGGSGGWGSNSSNTYSLNTAQGTVIAYVFNATASGATNRYLLSHGNVTSFPANPFFSITDFNQQLYVGWANGGVDGRLTLNTTGGALWGAGELFTIGLVYNNSGQRLYFKGQQRNSNTFTNFASTADNYFNLGDLSSGSGYYWYRAAGDGIIYVVAFDQAFSNDEMLEAEINPWFWAKRADKAPWYYTSATGVTLSVPSANIAVAGAVPSVAAGVNVAVPAAAVAVAAAVPSVATGASVAVPAADVAIAGVAPGVAAGVNVAVPAADVAIAALEPTVTASAVVNILVPSSEIVIAALEPTITASGGLRGRRSRRRRLWHVAEVPPELVPAVSAAEQLAPGVSYVVDAVDEAMSRYNRALARQSLQVQQRVLREAEAAIMAAVKRAQDEDEDDAMAVVL